MFFSAAPHLYLTFPFSAFTAVHVANVARPSVDAELVTCVFSISRWYLSRNAFICSFTPVVTLSITKVLKVELMSVPVSTCVGTFKY